MNDVVLADLTPLLPNILKKVPWYLRAALLIAGAIAALYVIAAHLWGLPLSHDALLWIGALELPFNLPAIANVTITKHTALSDAEKVAHAVAVAVSNLSLPAPVVHIYQDLKDKLEPVADVADEVAKAAPAAASTAAPVVSEVDAEFAKRSAAAKKAAATRKANAAAKAATAPTAKAKS